MPDALVAWIQIGVLFLAVVMALGIPWVRKRYANEKNDPVAEARVYLAFGRREQALEILKTALVAKPDDDRLRAEIEKIEKK